VRLNLLVPLLGLALLACKTEPQADSATQLSPAARSFVHQALAPFAGDTLIDHHVHVIGLGNSGSGIEVNADMQSLSHPFKYTRFNSFLDAAGIDDLARADQQYIDILLSQIEQIEVPLKVVGLALDRHYLENGEPLAAETEIYVPNQYLVNLSETHPEQIIPAISLHPYRKDAVSELEKWSKKGVRVVKWVPNAMGIDPSSSLCDPFYQAMNRLDMVLLSHAGEEQAIDSQGRQHLGNPLLLRRALNSGVKVIVAHCAVSGKSIDLDDPEGKRVKNFDLFMRLFDDPQYEGLLYADISAMTLLNQVGDPLKTMLERQDLHARLLYGSDYPLPAVDILNNNTALKLWGIIAEEDLPLLQEIQSYNPLLYNLVLLRSIRHPETGARFSTDLFLNRIP